MPRPALVAALLLWAVSVCPAEDWKRFESPAFEVYSNAGERHGRAAMVWLEQFRHVLGQLLGAPDLRAEAPIRILVMKRPPVAPALIAGRERWIIPLEADTAPPPELLRDLMALYLESIERMPAGLERGLVQLLSGIQIATTRVSVGAPPADPNPDWALAHMLVVDPEYFGKLRVLLANLRRGVDEDAAYRNAFGKPPAEVHTQAERYFAAGKFGTTELSGRPVAPRDFPVREADPAAPEQSLAEMRTSTTEQARRLRYHRSLTHFEAASRAGDLDTRIKELKAATQIAPRRDDWWQALAEAWLERKNFREAARAWRAAEQAAVDDAQRTRVRRARLSIEQQRLDYEAAEKKRVAEENERELRRLKEKAVSELRELETRVNRGQSASDPDEQVVPWWDGPQAEGQATGTLKQVDCIRGQARLVIETADRKTIRLLVRDPSRVAIIGGGHEALACGPQKPRKVKVEYVPKPDPRLATAGEVATLEFQ